MNQHESADKLKKHQTVTGLVLAPKGDIPRTFVLIGVQSHHSSQVATSITSGECQQICVVSRLDKTKHRLKWRASSQEGKDIQVLNGFGSISLDGPILINMFYEWMLVTCNEIGIKSYKIHISHLFVWCNLEP